MSDHPTDFNDGAIEHGQDFVKDAFSSAIKPGDEPAFIPKSCLDRGMLDTEPTVRETVITDVLPIGRVGGLIAAGGIGKSTLSCHVGACIAAGRDWLEHKTNQGSVLVLGAEDEEMEFHRRIKRLIRDWPRTDQEKAMKHLYFESRAGTRNLLTEKTNTGEVIQTPFADQLISAAKMIDDLRLIIIDPGSRFRGGKENSAEDTTRFVEALEYVSIETNTAILLVHHANKQSSFGKSGNQNAARGSSALVDGLRFVFTMSPLDDIEIKKFGIPPWQVKEIVKLSCAKTNYFKKFDDIYLDLSSGIEKMKLVEQVKVKISQTLGAKNTICEIIKEYAGKNVRYTNRKFCANFAGKQKRIGMSKNDLDVFLTDLVDEGILRLLPSPGSHGLLCVFDDPVFAEQCSDPSKQCPDSVPRGVPETVSRCPLSVPNDTKI